MRLCWDCFGAPALPLPSPDSASDDVRNSLPARVGRYTIARKLGEGGWAFVYAARDARLEMLVEVITAQARNFDWQTHPIFGRMSEAAWLRWAYLHIDHHLRQFGV